jgi:uroporphyrinogen III methyltransferase/synthase
MDQGYAKDTPASIISRGSTPFLRVITGYLDNIAARTEEARLPTPALLVVGTVVNLQEVLDWQKHLPLFGRRILSTRPTGRSNQELWEELTLLGAEVIHLPTIAIQPVPSVEVQAILLEIAKSSWVVFTSATAVEILFEALLESGRDWRHLDNARIAVIGGATGEALKERGRLPDLIAGDGNSGGMLETLLEHVKEEESIALCRARQRLPILAQGLQAAGVNFKEFTLYDLVQPLYEPGLVRKVFADPFDLAVFTSPLAARNLHTILERSGARLPEGTPTACLGPETAKELTKLGWQPWLVPAQPRLAELMDKALAEWGLKKDVSRD